MKNIVMLILGLMCGYGFNCIISDINSFIKDKPHLNKIKVDIEQWLEQWWRGIWQQ